MLCRGSTIPSKLDDAELANKLKGFDCQTISLLFPNIDIDNISSDYSEEPDQLSNDDYSSINESILETNNRSPILIYEKD